jgi:hypothetical protein
VIAYGFAFHRHAYLRDAWCQLDFVVVTLAWVRARTDVLLLSPSHHPWPLMTWQVPLLTPLDVQTLSSIRSVRALRPLRALKRVPGMPQLVEAILRCLHKIADVGYTRLTSNLTVSAPFLLMLTIPGPSF